MGWLILLGILVVLALLVGAYGLRRLSKPPTEHDKFWDDLHQQQEAHERKERERVKAEKKGYVYYAGRYIPLEQWWQEYKENEDKPPTLDS